jgi:hypothetical protein
LSLSSRSPAKPVSVQDQQEEANYAKHKQRSRYTQPELERKPKTTSTLLAARSFSALAFRFPTSPSTVSAYCEQTGSPQRQAWSFDRALRSDRIQFEFWRSWNELHVVGFPSRGLFGGIKFSAPSDCDTRCALSKRRLCSQDESGKVLDWSQKPQKYKRSLTEVGERERRRETRCVPCRDVISRDLKSSLTIKAVEGDLWNQQTRV